MKNVNEATVVDQPRPYRKFVEHLQDALFHAENIDALSADQKAEIEKHLSIALQITKLAVDIKAAKAVQS